MKHNKYLREAVFETIRNQIRANNPPETKITFDRLIKEGYTELETNQLIGQCVLMEIYDIMKNEQSFNEERFKKNLKNLPKKPIE